MSLNSGNSDPLAAMVAVVLAAGAAEFEVEREDGREHVLAVFGATGIGVASLCSDSDEAQELRRQLYALKRKRRKIVHAGVQYGLRLKIHQSFGEDVFRVTLTRI